MEKTVQGVIHGKTIELAEEIGLADGQRVEVMVTAKVASSWGDGIRRSAGVASTEVGFDEAFALIEQERKNAIHDT